MPSVDESMKGICEGVYWGWWDQDSEPRAITIGGVRTEKTGTEYGIWVHSGRAIKEIGDRSWFKIDDWHKIERAPSEVRLLVEDIACYRSILRGVRRDAKEEIKRLEAMKKARQYDKEIRAAFDDLTSECAALKKRLSGVRYNWTVSNRNLRGKLAEANGTVDEATTASDEPDEVTDISLWIPNWGWWNKNSTPNLVYVYLLEVAHLNDPLWPSRTKTRNPDVTGDWHKLTPIDNPGKLK